MAAIQADKAAIRHDQARQLRGEAEGVSIVETSVLEYGSSAQVQGDSGCPAKHALTASIKMDDLKHPRPRL